MADGPIRTFRGKRRTAYYLCGFILLMLYGGQVCPFLESLTLVQLGLPILTVLVVQYLIGVLWFESAINQKSYPVQSRTLFRVELSMFIVGGIAVTLFNTAVYGFPLESGAKLVLAMALMGFFAAADLGLLLEWQLSRLFEREGIQIDPEVHSC